MKIDVRQNLDGLEEALADGERQVRFATALALTRTAQDVRTEVQAEMRRVFDRPTPWTLGSTYLKAARRDDLTAVVGIRDGSQLSGRVTPEMTLRAQASGGGRNQKRFERALQAMGLLPAGWVAVPSRTVPLDGHGNVSGQYLKGLLRKLVQINAGPLRPGRGQRSAAVVQRQGGAYFVQRVGAKGLRPGIYQREVASRSPTAIMLFHSSVSYAQRLDMPAVGQRVVNDRFADHMAASLREAYGTAR
ncbi:MAG: hypothetical protein WBC18_07900 [Ottowia sp.]|uniref:hypothetical protein n=1 Tax=Ottowia sp. TaxID=1898956 RepID=UPI003C795A5F